MLKPIKPQVWAFDAEWVPDVLAGRLLHKLPEDMADDEIMQHMWQAGGATEEVPQPYLKTVLCRIVSISAVIRQERPNKVVTLQLRSLPSDIEDVEHCEESHILQAFLSALGERKPQIVGFNSLAADLKAFIQRGIVLGLRMPEFCARPDKPWQGIDYFSRGSEWHIDLKEILAGWGQGQPSLNEIATLSGIPGKIGVDGQQVPQLWLNGDLDKIVAYNEWDALTTYLLWLRVVHFSGHFTTAQYAEEEERVEKLLVDQSDKPHLAYYLQQWKELRCVARR